MTRIVCVWELSLKRWEKKRELGLYFKKDMLTKEEKYIFLHPRPAMQVLFLKDFQKEGKAEVLRSKGWSS